MKKKLSLLGIMFIFIFSGCGLIQTQGSITTSTQTFTPNPSATNTFIPSPTLTETLVPSKTLTETLSPTPIPEVDLSSFVFPFDAEKTSKLWKELNVPSQYRYFTYHINSRNSRDIPYEDKCGYHPGDLIMPIGSFTEYKDFTVEAKLPYSGTLVRKWITQGGDDGFTFYLGKNNNNDVYLNVYHTHTSSLSVGHMIAQGDFF